jgi:hypothetical protein
LLTNALEEQNILRVEIVNEQVTAARLSYRREAPVGFSGRPDQVRR